MTIDEVRDKETAAAFMAEQLGTTSDWWRQLVRWLEWQGNGAYAEYSADALRYAVRGFVAEHKPQAVPTRCPPIVRAAGVALRRSFLVLKRPGAHPITTAELENVIAEGIREAIIRAAGSNTARTAVDAAAEIVPTVATFEAMRQLCETAAVAGGKIGVPSRCICGQHPEPVDGWSVFPDPDGIPQAVLDEIRRAVLNS